MSKGFKWTTGVILLFVFGVVVSAFYSISQDNNKNNRVENSSSHLQSKNNEMIQTQNSVENLGITYQEFANRFNRVAQDKSVPFRMNSNQINWSDDRNVFSNLVNENVLISGTLAEDNLKELIIMGSGYGSKSAYIAGNNMILSFCTVAEVLSTKTKNPCKQIMDLMDTVLSQIDKGSTSIVIDDVRYSMSASKEKGIMLYIEKYNSNMNKAN